MQIDLDINFIPSRVASFLYRLRQRRNNVKITGDLVLQRFDEETAKRLPETERDKAWCTVRVMPQDGSYERAYRELERQSTMWEANYLPFFGSKWRIVPAASVR